MKKAAPFETASSENEKQNRESPLTRTPADGNQVLEPWEKYLRFGVKDVRVLIAYLREKDVSTDTVGKILSYAQSTDVVKAITQSYPNLHKEEVTAAKES